ncbi:pentatricopeptide repeat-containing protein [Tanacetum coccineum]
MLKHHNLLLDTPLIPSILKACGGLHYLKHGQQLHALTILNGCALVYGYARKGLVKEAKEVFGRIDGVNVVTWNGMEADWGVGGFGSWGYETWMLRVFDEMGCKDVGACNALISGFCRNGLTDEALEVFKRLRSAINIFSKMNIGSLERGDYLAIDAIFSATDSVCTLQEMCLAGFKADGTTVSSVLSTVRELGDLGVGVMIHGNALTDEAFEVFKWLQSQERELKVVSWTSVIPCCSQHGKDIEALELFREMQVFRVKPNYVTIPCLLPACGNTALMHGKSTHGFSLRTGISNNVHVGSAFIDIYGNCGYDDYRF